MARKTKITVHAALAFLGAAALLLVLPGAGTSQEAGTRSGWQPYLGCWSRTAAAEDAASQGVLCFVADGAEVEMVTIAGGQITHREPFPADGRARDIEQDGCRGTETGRFSGDLRRIYVESDVTCEDGARVSTSGILTMTSSRDWIDVRAVERDGEVAAWSQRYTRAYGDHLAQVGLADGAADAPVWSRIPWSAHRDYVTVDEVIEAASQVHPQAVQAWLAESGANLAGLDADALIEMDDAGVPGEIIDMVVAVSFPSRFALNRQDAAGGADLRPRRTIWAGRPYDPFRYGSFGGYSPFGYGLYSPYGYGGYYGSYGYGGYRGYYRPVIVERIPESVDAGGRVVAGRGYRGPRSVVPPSSGGSRSSGGWTRSGGSGSTGAATRGGSSGGTRKAKPRSGSGS